MVKYVLFALMLAVAGCSANPNVTEKQVNPHHPNMLAQGHTAAPTPVVTKASSTSTSNPVTIKGVPGGFPSNLLDMIQMPSGTTTGQTPTGTTTGQTPGGTPVYQVPTGTTTGQTPGGTPVYQAPTGTTTGQTPGGYPYAQTPSGYPSTQTPSYSSPAGSAGGAQQTAGDSSQFAQQVLDLVNQERGKAGLNSLTMNADLAKMAMVKAKDMYDNKYFDHNSPTHGSPFDMMKEFGITFNSGGENIAQGQSSPTQVMNDWMNSPGHRANILNSTYTQIGIAYYNGDWVQEFIG